ncbi:MULTISPECIES: DUF3153 domain-containing protein [unclassified Leptolyngbya]|uniref:DUF3153 domain-containing protein n=1 Tax=unclassified Leptolyngbya TaxID=2650499 RepID=UPI00168A36E2|nr:MULTISPECIES: DUF3153 domain-containing protein [unclassified Leptolyngbya]MBD1911348.1 DUF3153 domain-containing protein [Leptolyngbya sp. FACHB-8]MBD2156634.1 DUF3153 domain-containing protein [Leptolyngbya sp. FACHB-16]
MKRFLPFLLALVAMLGLSGCVRYDLGINYFSQTRGEIVQRIRLGESVTTFNEAIARDWLRSLERRTKELGGKARRRSLEELSIRIPFTNGAELTHKFNRFFEPPSIATTEEDEDTEAMVWPEIVSHLALEEQNGLLVQRNRLVYDLDVRSLGLLAPNGNVLVGPGALLELDFSLNTPWGARVMPGSALPQRSSWNRNLTWTLKTSEASHLEVVFWVPSPLGLGTVVILVVVVLGSILKSFLKSPGTA